MEEKNCNFKKKMINFAAEIRPMVGYVYKKISL